MASILPLDQANYGRSDVDLNTSRLFDRHGNVCGCPQFWGLCTDLKNVEPSLPDQPSDHLSSGCPQTGNTSHQRHAPLPLGAATEVAMRANMSKYAHTPRLHPMSTAEPHAQPSRELKETCIFWYHGNCRHGADCPFEHELNHNWPIFRPHGYSHKGHRRCNLQFCPFRTDLEDFMQQYYPHGLRVDEILKELDVKDEEAKQTSMTLGDQNDKPNGDETDDGWIGFNSQSNSKEKKNDAINEGSVADITSARLSDGLQSQAPSVQAAPLGPPKVVNLEEHLSPHAEHLDAEDTALEREIDSASTPTNGDHPNAHFEVHPERQKKYKKTHKRRRTGKLRSARQPDQTSTQPDEEQLDVGSVVEYAEEINREGDTKRPDAEGSNNEHYEAGPASTSADEDRLDARLEVDAGSQMERKAGSKKKPGKKQRVHLRTSAEAQKMGSAPEEEVLVPLPTAIASTTVDSSALVMPQLANTGTVAILSSSPTLPPPGPPHTSLPPTSISHADTGK